jgi:Fe-S oxidoreductase
MKFDYFVLPFSLGMAFLFIYLGITYTRWFMRLEKPEKAAIRKGFFSPGLFKAIWEIIRESLLHRNIFRKNLLLGFMHMSLAFGWFLLIAIGNLEGRLYEPTAVNLPYVPIFFKFFHASPHPFTLHKLFSFVMDLLLLLVLSGVLLAWGKRIVSKAFGMKRTTKLSLGDKMAMMSLWLIFPLRLLAESLSHALYGTGDFLTGTVGDFLGTYLPASVLFYPAWWAYSLALGVFFVALPFSRYMHIPTEVVLIFSRHFGLKEKDFRTPITDVEVHSCSRCGICIDACQISFAGGINNVQSAYQLRAIRYNQIDPSDLLNCMMCGRCENACPVGINIKNIRLISRNELNGHPVNPKEYSITDISPVKADVIYFGGCMTHQTPSVKKSMIKIMRAADVNYWFMDEQGGICCGRPSILAGHMLQAKAIIENNIRLIKQSGAKTFVTSCPICYKVFKQDYKLDITVLHHTEFINNLILNNKLKVEFNGQTAVYHDPCELSRDIRIYDEPRAALRKVVHLAKNNFEKDDSLCCGGSLANLTISMEKRLEITRDAYNKLTKSKPDYLVTSCPQCKKSFEKAANIPVIDFAELIWQGVKHAAELSHETLWQKDNNKTDLTKQILTTAS